MDAEATTGADDRGRQGIWKQVAMTALTMVLLGVLLSWQVRQGSDEVAPPIIGSATPADGRTKPHLEVRARPVAWTEEMITVHLVGSLEEAVRAYSLLDVASSGGVEPVASDLVLVVSSEQELAQVHQLITGLRDVGQQVQVVDQRGRGVAWLGVARLAAEASRAAQPRVYIVASEADAGRLLAGIEQANNSRHTLGLPPLDQRVVWFDSAEAEAHFQQGINDENLMRAEPGLPPVSAVDLRRR